MSVCFGIAFDKQKALFKSEKQQELEKKHHISASTK